MSEDGKEGDPRRGELSPQEREAMKQRAAQIGKRLDDVKARKVPRVEHDRARGKSFADAFKIVGELVVGVAIGGGLGWFLDRPLHTAPWVLVLFLILGFAAGMLNVIRTAQRMQAASEPMQRGAKSVADDDDDDDAVKPDVGKEQKR